MKIKHGRKRVTSLNLDAYWQALKSDLAGCDSEMEFPTIIVNDVSTAKGNVRLGVNGSGLYLLLLPCDSNLLRKELPHTTGLDLNVKTYTVRGKKKLFLEVVCLDIDLNETFTDLVKNICERVTQGQSPLQSAVGAIDDFLELLKKVTLKVTDDELLGLLGELLQLELHSKNEIGTIENWTGPDKKRHDFIFDGVSVEVKTSQRTGSPVIKVHGIDQLKSPPDGKLYLSYFRVESVPAGGVTIPEIVEKLKLVLPATSLKEKLKLYGYSESTLRVWEKYKWNVIERKFYIVDSGFPKLTVSELGGKPLPGISEIQYSVNLDLAENSLINQDELIAAIRECM